jgi:hypothetical protein
LGWQDEYVEVVVVVVGLHTWLGAQAEVVPLVTVSVWQVYPATQSASLAQTCACATWGMARARPARPMLIRVFVSDMV